MKQGTYGLLVGRIFRKQPLGTSDQNFSTFSTQWYTNTEFNI